MLFPAYSSKKAEIKKATAEANEKANKKIDKLLKEKSDADEKLKEALKSAKAANADEDVTAVRFLCFLKPILPDNMEIVIHYIYLQIQV